MIVRRKLLRIGAAVAAFPMPALAQAWPSKPIRIVCTYPPGGLTDVFARAYGEFVGQKLGQAVVVENKTGAAGAIGAEIVKQATQPAITPEIIAEIVKQSVVAALAARRGGE